MTPDERVAAQLASLLDLELALLPQVMVTGDPDAIDLLARVQVSSEDYEWAAFALGHELL